MKMKTELNGNFRMSLKQYLGGNFIALNTMLEKNERLINDISSYFKKLERKDQTQSVKKGNNKDQGKHQ